MTRLALGLSLPFLAFWVLPPQSRGSEAEEAPPAVTLHSVTVIEAGPEGEARTLERVKVHRAGEPLDPDGTASRAPSVSELVGGSLGPQDTPARAYEAGEPFPWLGAAVRSLAPEQSTAAHRGRGALIHHVCEDSSAATAGLRKGDVITAFNGSQVYDIREFVLAVRETEPGEGFEVIVVRDGSYLTIPGAIGDASTARCDGLQTADLSSVGTMREVRIQDISDVAEYTPREPGSL